MLKIENLHASVAGKEILKGLSLDLQAGQVHALQTQRGACSASYRATSAANPSAATSSAPRAVPS